MNTSPPPVLYRVTDSEGDLVMLAPLDIVAVVWGLQDPAVRRILAETSKLENRCRLSFEGCPRSSLGYPWIEVERLPIGIPAGERTDEKV